MNFLGTFVLDELNWPSVELFVLILDFVTEVAEGVKWPELPDTPPTEKSIDQCQPRSRPLPSFAQWKEQFLENYGPENHGRPISRRVPRPTDSKKKAYTLHPNEHVKLSDGSTGHVKYQGHVEGLGHAVGVELFMGVGNSD